MPKAKEKSIKEGEPEVLTINMDDDEPTLQMAMHGVINPIEARHHAQ